MNDKLRRLKSTYNQEVSVYAQKANSRSVLLRFVKEEIKSRLEVELNELSVAQLNATRLLISYIDGKLQELPGIAGSFNEKQSYVNYINEVDGFFQNYAFIKTIFDKVLYGENPQQQELKSAVVVYFESLQAKSADTAADDYKSLTPAS